MNHVDDFIDLSGAMKLVLTVQTLERDLKEPSRIELRGNIVGCVIRCGDERVAGNVYDLLSRVIDRLKD